MRARKVPIGVLTCNAYLKVHAEALWVDRVPHLFDSLFAEAGVAPDVHSYGVLFRMYYHAQALDRLLQVVDMIKGKDWKLTTTVSTLHTHTHTLTSRAASLDSNRCRAACLCLCVRLCVFRCIGWPCA
jgi:hypothetical protein